MQRECHYSGDGAESVHQHKEQGEDQLGHCAIETTDRPWNLISRAMQCVVACAKKCEWDRQENWEHSSPDRHLNRLPHFHEHFDKVPNWFDEKLGLGLRVFFLDNAIFAFDPCLDIGEHWKVIWIESFYPVCFLNGRNLKRERLTKKIARAIQDLWIV